jgi:hypothetical protein
LGNGAASPRNGGWIWGWTLDISLTYTLYIDIYIFRYIYICIYSIYVYIGDMRIYIVYHWMYFPISLFGYVYNMFIRDLIHQQTGNHGGSVSDTTGPVRMDWSVTFPWNLVENIL